MVRKRHEMMDHESALPTSAPDSVNQPPDDGTVMREAIRGEVVRTMHDFMEALFVKCFGGTVTAQAPQPPLRSRDTETKQNV